MAFIRRDAGGRIAAVSDVPGDGFSEELAADDTELRRYIQGLQSPSGSPRGNLDDSDQGLVRVLEDLIEVLVEKQLICLEDLPEDARNKLQTRQQLRAQLRREAGQA